MRRKDKNPNQVVMRVDRGAKTACMWVITIIFSARIFPHLKEDGLKILYYLGSGEFVPPPGILDAVLRWPVWSIETEGGWGEEFARVAARSFEDVVLDRRDEIFLSPRRVATPEYVPSQQLLDAVATTRVWALGPEGGWTGEFARVAAWSFARCSNEGRTSPLILDCSFSWACFKF